MNARLCPNCSALIESESALFCYNCGQELVISHTDVPHSNVDSLPAQPARASAKKSPGSLLVLFLLFLIVLSGIILGWFVFNDKRIERVTLSPTQSVLPPLANEYVSTVSALPVAPYNLADIDFASLVPAQASLFIQSRTPALLLKRALTDKDKEQFSKKTGLTLTEALSFLGDDYAVAKMSEGFLFLSKVKDVDFVKVKIKEYSNEVIAGVVVDDVLAVSDSPDILDKVGLASSRKLLSLTQDSEFFESQRNLSKVGQALIFSRDKDSLNDGLQTLFGTEIVNTDLDQLKGKSFVIDSASGSTKIVGSYGK